MVWRQGFEDYPVQLLVSLGVAPHQADAVVAEINATGGLLSSLGLSECSLEMFKSLHTNSWFVYGGLDTVIVCSRGGRQGCRLGGIVFNLI